MDTLFESGVHLTLGSPVTAVFFIDGRPSAAFCHVASEAPLFLETSDATAARIDYPRPVMLLWQGDGRLLKGEASAVSMQPGKAGRTIVEVREVLWEDLERRRHARVPMRVPCMLRAVRDLDAGATVSVFPGETADVSMGGAWIDTEAEIEAGSLVEFQASFAPGEFVRTLGIVPHRDPKRGGFGVAFLEYVGDSKNALARLLRAAA